jgi:PAS domain S-box-containing protein
MNNEVYLLKERIDALESEVNMLQNRLQEVHKLFDTHSIPIIVTDLDDNIRIANAQAIKLFGYNSEEIYSGNFFRNLLSKRDQKKWDRQKQKLLDTDQANGEIRILANSGKHLDIEITSMNFYYDGDISTLSYLRDVTDQKIIENKYKQEYEKYHFILDAIPAMVFIKDGDNRVISVNKSFEDITGLKRKDTVGKSVFDLTDNLEIAEKYWRDDLEVIETGVARRNIIEPLFTDPNRWFVTDKIPLTYSDGEVNGIIGFSIDITERKHAEDALIRSEKKLRLLFNTAPDGIVLGNLEGNILAANKAFLDMVGYDLKELLEKNYCDIMPQKWIGPTKRQIKEFIKSGFGSGVIEKEYSRKDGTIVPVLVSGWVMFDENNKPFQMGAYVKDLTAIKKTEELEKELLKKDKEQLEKDLATKNRELNTKVTQLIETNELVTDVISRLEDLLKVEGEDKNRQIRYIINGLLNHSNDDLWMQFEITFGQIHTSFYDDLFDKYPNLTPNERKICAFLKMNLSTKDISSITHQTIRGIEVARFRLRKKMNLPRSTNLTKYLTQF